MYSNSIILRKKLLAGFTLATLLTASMTLSATPIKSSHTLLLKKVNPFRPTTKFEIIAAVKKKFTGRILSVKKKSKPFNNDCHHVKFIDDKGELFVIQVECTKY